VRIDAILPTYNRADLLPRALDSALSASIPRDHDVQIVVVDNNSSDQTKAVVERYASPPGARFKYLFEPKQGRHHALNCGIAQSSADVIAFFDDDERLVPTWFETIAENFARPEIDFIGGPVLPDWSAAPPPWLPKDGYGGVIGIIDHGNRRRHYCSPEFPEMLTGGNTAIRHSVLTACGPYSPDYMYTEDRYMWGRLRAVGATGDYIPELIVYHHIPLKRLQKSYFRQWVRNDARNRGKMARTTAPTGQTVLGAPPWMWRAAATAAFNACVGGITRQLDEADRFKAELDMIEFAGFMAGRNFPGLAEKYIDRA
jgi:glycosyltransferase involved in cell wall biosynthesis